ncbi:CHASE2 domain-containing protein [Waterburya agarophytonicola K14]|uniref:histidine kinase n=2 Tax=Waterburya TaxID=2886915 RepID=A0A964FDQ7_9CYAN|nr:CHASE2 domain-containing protein [Waterburya agarophytonicola KI4]
MIHNIELANYDLLFYIQQQEPIDRRITLIEWDENSINTLQESIISDNTLNLLLNKVLRHNPITLGLDLYRDIPVPSFKLDREANIQAYNSLSRTFMNNSNIIGIQKIVFPKIEPTPVLAKNGRVAASDLYQDLDVRVRKAYTFPNIDVDGNPTEIPYIGVALAYQYLAKDGWLADNIIDGLNIHKDNKSIVLGKFPTKLSASKFVKDDSQWKFLLNWRKTKLDDNFQSISVAEILKESKNLDNLFSDRLVIIGNVTSYNGDTHRTPLDRFSTREELMNGVEIVAQVSSSIISAALDDRNLIHPAPLWVEYALLILPMFSIAKKCEDFFNSNGSLSQLRLRTFIYGILYIAVLCIICLVSFQNFGIWISITPSIIGIILSWICFNTFSQSQKEKRDFHYLKLLMKDFKHNIRGVSRQIASANRGIHRNNKAIASKINDNLSLFENSEIEFLDNLLRQNIDSITTRNQAIDAGIIRINRYQERTANFLNYTYSSFIHNIEVHDLNFKINEFINQFISEQRIDYTYSIEPNYDELVIAQKVHIDDWLIIVENLISNAVYAINPELNQSKSFEPKIKLKTINTPKNIKLIVEDNGMGIPEELQQKIFFPFVSFKEGRGDGMGLHLVSQIINCRKGKLTLESNSMTGTIFMISLPKIY